MSSNDGGGDGGSGGVNKRPGELDWCEFHGCSRRPVFSHEGEKPRFCLAHKLYPMQDNRPNAEGRRCATGAAGSRPAQVAAAQQREYGYNRPGDWECPSCSNHCFADHVECIRCHTPQPEGPGAGYERGGSGYDGGGGGGGYGGGGGGGGYNRRPGDWECPACGDNCFASCIECNRCHTPKPHCGGGGGGGGNNYLPAGIWNPAFRFGGSTANKPRSEVSDQGVGENAGHVEPPKFVMPPPSEGEGEEGYEEDEEGEEEGNRPDSSAFRARQGGAGAGAGAKDGPLPEALPYTYFQDLPELLHIKSQGLSAARSSVNPAGGDGAGAGASADRLPTSNKARQPGESGQLAARSSVNPASGDGAGAGASADRLPISNKARQPGELSRQLVPRTGRHSLFDALPDLELAGGDTTGAASPSAGDLIDLFFTTDFGKHQDDREWNGYDNEWDGGAGGGRSTGPTPTAGGSVGSTTPRSCGKRKAEIPLGEPQGHLLPEGKLAEEASPGMDAELLRMNPNPNPSPNPTSEDLDRSTEEVKKEVGIIPFEQPPPPQPPQPLENHQQQPLAHPPEDSENNSHPPPAVLEQNVVNSTPESAHATLVTQFGSSAATYAAEDAGVRLHVRAGSMAEGQVAGPIVIQTDKRLLVECGGSSLLVSAVVDCQPSGSTFDVPLDLDFLVEEGPDEQSDDSEDASRDEVFNECKEIIRNTYKVLKRQQSGDPWDILSDEEVAVVREDGVFCLRAKFGHFTEGCLARNILLDNAVQTEMSKIGRPRKKQLEFINATDKTLTFLVLPTTWSNKAIKSLAVSVGVEEIVEAKASVERAVEQAVLTEAMEPQVLQIPPMNRQGNPKGGEQCTWDVCDLPASGGGDARVALVTVENATVSVWFSRIVKERTRLMVLPGQFSAGMNPQLGKHPLPQGSRCLVSNTFTAKGGEPMTVANAPVSTISSNGSTSVEEMDQEDG